MALAVDVFTRSRLQATTTLKCDSDYADTFEGESERARDIEKGLRGQYSYMVRSSARYECPFFGPDGKLKRRVVRATELGSAFAYEQLGNETFLLTNEHVASWPEVTDPRNRVDGVPEGCRRMDEKLRVVHDEHDDYEPGQITLMRVAVDPLLDAAILKANQRLTVLPYRIGKSGRLRQGNAVRVRGFPLGLMQAVNEGKIVNTYDRDQEQGWDHVDFVIDALLAEGNSGSPVLALSCATREPELVGLYHAGYRGHSALNVVVGIDQLTDFMRRKKRVPRAIAAAETPNENDPRVRAALREDLSTTALPFVDFGGAIVRAEPHEQSILYHVYSKPFPLEDQRQAVLEDPPPAAAAPGAAPLSPPANHAVRLWVSGPAGWRPLPLATLGPDDQELISKLLESLRLQVAQTLAYRKTVAAATSPDDRRKARELGRTLGREGTLARDLMSNFSDLLDRVLPGAEAGPAVPAPGPLPTIGPPGPSATRPAVVASPEAIH